VESRAGSAIFLLLRRRWASGLLGSDAGASAAVLVYELDVGGSFLAKASRPALSASSLAVFEGARLVRSGRVDEFGGIW
jgi:hypothetical protein